jgi:hypothetical protein
MNVDVRVIWTDHDAFDLSRTKVKNPSLAMIDPDDRVKVRCAHARRIPLADKGAAYGFKPSANLIWRNTAPNPDVTLRSEPAATSRSGSLS